MNSLNMPRSLSVVIGFLLAGALVLAQSKEEISEPIYAGGSLKVPSGTLGKLDVRDDAALKVVWKGGEWRLPYNRVQTLYASLSRPSALVELAGVAAAFTLSAFRNRKTYLSLRFEESDGTSHYCYFLIPPGTGETVDVLAKKSNRNVVFESEEARRRLYGRR